MWMEDFEV